MVGLSYIAKLKEYILAEQVSEKLTSELHKNTGNTDTMTVFLSVCNKKERARVFHGSGKTLLIAWVNAEKWLKDYQKKQLAKKRPLIGTWVKADVVTDYETILTEDLRNEIDKSLPYFFRKGIAFNDNFTVAYLESEINCNKMLNYAKDKKPFNMKRIN